ncbi:MAG: Stk1 family PASTA domain-containing Ser/Thr kinase [Roseburia sp.]|nr:Stk1 family PASTA domain-containing Ser/Thr kinase [Ruminococcus sp.]MCM1154442.1 Stk1 family PASTA domain-containing Ser/Thr kinase [Roseburia sp.]MCM1241868.1 Stk1 family PASTA domain-containing Ser/Thr kinase [Roseburia sp.]
MIKMGMMIGDRYEILEKIGTGGMSDVYKAKDHKLNRFVAVKVLKQEFGENENFVSKFRIEAQAAAGLMHPNIVNVYDVGEEGEIHYIVMELVEGITLKKYIEKKARLSVKEAISIAIQVSMGIEAAHNNHIIHRDIKPQNIIISKEGKVKVTDFGIAKAATSNTITSNVMGSVHYTSPEQARGGYSDEKSDIYSLGITMFEMLTGRVPFNGETTVAIAIKHIQEELPSPREYIAEIPISVEQIVYKCCQKSPDRRYQSMGELIVDLKQSLMNPDEDFVKVIDPDEEASTRMITDKDMAQIKRQSDRRDSMDEAMRLKKDSRHYYERYEEDEEDEDEDDEEEEYYEDEDDEDDDYDPKVERITTVLAVVAALLVGGIIIFLVGRTFGLFGGETDAPEEETGQTQEVEQVQMIEVAGKTLDEVKRALIDLGLTPEIEYEESDTYEEGIVIRASVRAGEMVDKNKNVVLTVAQGSEAVAVPSVIGKSQAEATSILEKAGFVVNATESYDTVVESGHVISQSPEAEKMAPKGSAITIRVSQGAESTKVRVPNVYGQTEMDAVAILTESGLSAGTISQTNHEDPAMTDRVCYQSYSEGSYVDKGTPIDLKVSIGPAAVTYKYTDNITAPTEDPEYQPGMSVAVVLTAADGTQLLNTETASFPIMMDRTGILSATGTIQFTFIVTTPASTTTDPNTGEQITIEGTVTQKIVTREVAFTAE